MALEICSQEWVQMELARGLMVTIYLYLLRCWAGCWFKAPILSRHCHWPGAQTTLRAVQLRTDGDIFLCCCWVEVGHWSLNESHSRPPLQALDQEAAGKSLSLYLCTHDTKLNWTTCGCLWSRSGPLQLAAAVTYVNWQPRFHILAHLWMGWKVLPPLSVFISLSMVTRTSTCSQTEREMAAEPHPAGYNEMLYYSVCQWVTTADLLQRSTLSLPTGLQFQIPGPKVEQLHYPPQHAAY